MKPNFWYDSDIWYSLLGQLENDTWMYFNPLPFLEEIISLYLFKRVAYDLGG